MSSDELKERLEPFLTIESTVVAPISTLILTIFFYGVYAMIFGRCVQILVKRSKDRPNQKLHLGWTTALFFQATTMVAFTVLTQVRQSILSFNTLKTQNYAPLYQFLMHDTLKTAQDTIGNILSVLINATAESMLIHRCYILWGSRKIIAYPLIFLSVSINSVGLASVIMGAYGEDPGDPKRDMIYMIGSQMNDFGWTIPAAIFNSLLTFLTAVKLWYRTRQQRELLGKEVDRRHKTVIAIIIESGLLLPAVSIVYLVVNHIFNTQFHNTVPVYLGPIRDLIAALAPTLIIVRAASETRNENANQVTVMSSLQFNNEIGQDRRSCNLSVVIQDIRYPGSEHHELSGVEESPGVQKVEISSV